MAATGPGVLGVSVLHAAQLLLQAADALPCSLTSALRARSSCITSSSFLASPAPERPPPLGAAMLVEAADVEAPGRVEPGAEAGRLSDSTLRRLTFRSRCLLGT